MRRYETAELGSSSTASDIQTAIEDLEPISVGGVAVSGSSGTWSVTFKDARDHPLLFAGDATGSSAVYSVTRTQRGNLRPLG